MTLQLMTFDSNYIATHNFRSINHLIHLLEETHLSFGEKYKLLYKRLSRASSNRFMRHVTSIFSFVIYP
jgi:hypothetical protein